MNRSSKMGLALPTTSDAFVTSDLAANFQTVDDSPGTFVCTSSARPTTWGSAQNGREIYETDTKLKWRWNGSSFERSGPKGWLQGNSIVTDYSTALTTLQTAMSAFTIVPAGGRKIKVTATWHLVENTNGRTSMGLFRDGVQIQQWEERGTTSGTADTNGVGRSMVAWDTPGAGGGTFTYSLKICATSAGGTSAIRAGATTPATLDVEES